VLRQRAKGLVRPPPKRNVSPSHGEDEAEELTTTVAPLEAPVLRARDSRLGITKPSEPEPGPQPLSWEEVDRRSRAGTIEPGSVHPWRRPSSLSRRAITADKITDPFGGQSH